MKHLWNEVPALFPILSIQVLIRTCKQIQSRILSIFLGYYLHTVITYCFISPSIVFFWKLYIRYAQPTLWLDCGFRLICLKVSTRNYVSIPSTRLEPDEVRLQIPKRGATLSDGWSCWYSRVGYRKTCIRRGAASVYVQEFYIPLAEARILLAVVAPLQGIWRTIIFKII